MIIKNLIKGDNFMKRYVVEFKAFKTGEWYVKSETDSIAAATSVALVWSNGREYRIIDTETDTIIREGY
jgi:hypothetical protein